MRAEVVAWTILTAALWTVVATSDGRVQAAAFMVALLSTAISIGLSIIATIDFLQSSRVRGWTHRVLHRGRSPLCSSCSRAMAPVGELLMCASCDGAVLEMTG